MIYKCLNCGGALKFDPESRKMVCDYCVSFFDMAEINKHMGLSSDSRGESFDGDRPTKSETAAENETAAGSKTAAESETAAGSEAFAEDFGEDEYMECNVYQCSSCGGELLVNGLETSTFCAYCGQPTIVFNRVSRELKPKYIVPFSVTKEDAISAIREKLNAGYFVPDEVKAFEAERVRGIYIPYWLCDVDYKDRQSLRGTVGSGKSSHTEYFYRKAECSFRNITLDASVRLNDETSQRLEPFNTSLLEEFDTGYLSGYYADRYDVSDEQIKGLALTRAKRFFDEEVAKSVRARDVRIIDNAPEMKIRDMKYVLLPAWFLTFRYQGEAYTFLVNGQTRKVVGCAPYSMESVKIMVFALSVLFSMLTAFFLSAIMPSFTDLEDSYEFVFMIIFFAFCGLGSGIKFFDKVKMSMALSKSQTMFNYVKDRQKES